MGNSTLVTTLYVNPVLGNDANTGSRLNPYKSLSRALKETITPKIIKLAPGTYSNNSELFPIFIPPGVTVVGNEATKGKGILITGSGEYQTQSFGKQNVTLLLLGDAQLRGVTVTNPTAKGTGVWIESTPTLANNTFSNCGREGVFVSGSAKPTIVDNFIVLNSAGGLVIARNSKGEVLRNILQKNAFGIVISDFATPLVANNKLSGNCTGIGVSRNAQPVLRHNLLEKNTSFGLLVNGNAIPNLGSTQDTGGNIFRDHGQFDLQNLTSRKLVSAGNHLNPTQVKGLVEFIAVTEPKLISVNTGFSDIAGHWAAAFVEALSSRKLISGFSDGTFAPQGSITRGQFAAIIAKAFQLPTSKKIRAFTDVKPDFWAASAIYSATSMGFFHSFPDGTFRPMQNLTKIQAIVSMVNGLKLSGGNLNVLSVYRDRAQIKSFVGQVAVATQKLLVVNYPQTEQLEPLREITRAEVAALIHQALVAIGVLKPIASPYIVNPDLDLPSFSDLVGHWAEPFIRSLVSMNLTRGFADGTYKPDKPTTRAQYAALVVAAFNPRPKPVSDFTDVPKDFWAYKDIKIAAGSGFVGGLSDRTFRPHQNVQRLQVIVSLVNGLALKAESPDALLAYNDRNTIPDSARIAVATATKQRIIVNYPDAKQIQPFREATRGEVAAMVYQALVATGKTPAIDSPYIVSHTSY